MQYSPTKTASTLTTVTVIELMIRLSDLCIHMSHFAYACKTERQNGISHLISELLHTLDSSLRDRHFDVTEWRTVAYPGLLLKGPSF